MNRHWLLVLFFLLFATSLSFAQNTSNKGKDFWVTYSGHVNGTSSKLTLFLSADRATTYTVYIGNAVIASGNITANTCLPVIIDPNSHPVYIDGSDIIESNKGIHVVSESPISLYSVISFNARTGGTLVLPTNTLGKEYYTYSYQSSITNGNYAQFTILAVEDETEIEITPTSGNAQHLANVTFTITLNKGQIYQFQARDDLSGSHIKSIKECKTIAVFSGNTWASFCERGNNRSASGGDNLYQQLFPVTAWGRNFVTAPFYNTIHGNTDVIRVIVSEDNTVLTVNGRTNDANGTTLSNPYRKGSVVTFFSTSANIISGSNPISVAQYQTSQTCNLNNHAQVNQNAHDPYEGDPEITVLNPVEQTLTNITVYSKLKNVPTNIVKFFINVIIKTADIPSFRLDGNAVSGFVNIGAGYSYAIIDVTSYPQDQHRLTAAGGFSAIAYGYGYVESYAYLAGANIQNFIFQPLNEATGKNITSGCLGEIIRLKINLPYQPTKLIWNVNNGDGTITQTAPTSSDTFTDKGIDYYTYFYPNEIKYNTPDDYQFKVIATKPTADNCGNMEEELIADFTVDNQPTADPDVPATGCQSSGIQFTDKSKSNSDTRSIASWLWDFGDGETSTEQNPIHIFKKAGLFNVILTATTDSKCSDTHMPVSILINPQPLSDFEVSALCKGKPIKIIEKSTIENPGKIVKWTWNFGDGSADDTNQIPVHQYAATGSYTITLITESDKGCISVVKTNTVTVIDPRPAEFELPDFCLIDGIAKFKNSSKNPDGTVTGLTAQWTYTDNNGNVVASSVGFNGAFTPIATGDYTITLILTNQDGCVVSTVRKFTVNGDVKEANFDIINDHSCVSEDIIIKNTSTVFTGKITKIEIYRDYPNEASIYKTIPYPDDSEIHLKYDTFGGTTDRTYNIRLVAFSGEKCFEFLDKQITLKSVPQLEFEDMPAVCDADGTVRITQARQKVGEGMAGTGVYSGDGIKPDGTFNPKIAGVGFHEITYTYTGEKSCSASITKSIEVYKSPVADAGALIYILAGGQIEIPATAEGTNLKYQWSPAIGLNKTDILNPIASPEKDTEYTLTATTQPDGCTTTSSIMIKVLQSLNPPNAFTPNGDNVNDTWNIKYLESYPNATIEIFNRNGNKVFFSNGYKVPFDGTYQTEPLPVGVYYYIINPRNGRKTITGPLTIIR